MRKLRLDIYYEFTSDFFLNNILRSQTQFGDCIKMVY